MSMARRGEVWQVDFGMIAKVRPALLLTDESDEDNELDIVTVVLHTTALRGNKWEVSVPKHFLKPGAFHCQQVQTISASKLMRRLGVLSSEEFAQVLTVLGDRLGFSR
jgi:mRNA interferase MazF